MGWMQTALTTQASPKFHQLWLLQIRNTSGTQKLGHCLGPPAPSPAVTPFHRRGNQDLEWWDQANTDVTWCEWQRIGQMSYVAFACLLLLSLL